MSFYGRGDSSTAPRRSIHQLGDSFSSSALTRNVVAPHPTESKVILKMLFGYLYYDCIRQHIQQNSLIDSPVQNDRSNDTFEGQVSPRCQLLLIDLFLNRDFRVFGSTHNYADV